MKKFLADNVASNIYRSKHLSSIVSAVCDPLLVPTEIDPYQEDNGGYPYVSAPSSDTAPGCAMFHWCNWNARKKGVCDEEKDEEGNFVRENST